MLTEPHSVKSGHHHIRHFDVAAVGEAAASEAVANGAPFASSVAPPTRPAVSCVSTQAAFPLVPAEECYLLATAPLTVAELGVAGS